MNRLLKTLLFWTLLLGACSINITTPQTLPTILPSLTPFQPSLATIPTNEVAPGFSTTQSPNPKFITTLSAPHIDPGPNGELPQITPEAPTSVTECGYQWAYQDLPELTKQFDSAVRNLIPYSTAHATAFGENCVASNGQIVRFAAMETDFYVIITIGNLDEYETFGNWIVQVMQVVNDFPPDMITGPRPGFVEFRFEKTISESIGFRVPIQVYNDTANGKTGEELFRLFYAIP